VDLSAQCLAHLAASHVGDGVEGETVEQLIVVEQVLPYAVDDQMQQFVFFVQKERHGEIPDLFLRVLVGRDEVDGLEVAKVDIPPQDVYVQKLFPPLDKG